MRLLLTAAGAALAGVLLFADSRARAADPTTADCLSASDASLKSGNAHKLRAERSQLLVCAAASCPADIRKECMSRVDDVNRQIPTVTFAVKDGSGADLSAVKVTMDGEVLAERVEGTALSIDPGEHVFTFETAGQPSVSKKLVIQQSQKDRREVITLGTPSTPAADGAASATTGNAAVAAPSADGAGSSDGMSTKRAAGWVVGGVGVAGVGVAVFFGVRAVLFNNKTGDETNTANDPTVSPADRATFLSAAQSDHSSAVTNQAVAIVSGVAGGLALGAGIFLLLTSGGSAKAPASTGTLVLPAWERGGGGLTVRSAW